MDKAEASRILEGQIAPYRTWTHARLSGLIEGEHLVRVHGPSGTEYLFELCVQAVNECDDTLEVEGTVTVVGARLLNPPSVHARFLVSTSGTISGGRR